MSNDLRISRGGFVVIKLFVDGEICLLLRRNSKWKDLNLIGGHEKDRDQTNLEKTALRELWEEVPSIRAMSNFTLEPLGDLTQYGPIYSRSVGTETLYVLQYFLLKIGGDPTALLENLGAKTRNVLVSQSEILQNGSGRISGLALFLDKFLPGGIRGIPMSSPVNLHLSPGRWTEPFEQLEFSTLNWVR
ncbi:MAG: NUDIX hydrolase [Afipia sp.]|nr:NUDIX hydrolase [Afipia sp.]